MSPRSSAPAWLALAAAGCGVGGTVERAPAAPPLVVLIVADTLRWDALSCYGCERRGERPGPITPAIDALAAEGLRFERAYSAAPWTLPSLTTILSGAWPWEHGATRLLDVVPERVELLPERLRAAGWQSAGVMTNFLATGKYGFAQGWDRWDDALARGHEGSSGGEAVARLLAAHGELAAASAARGTFLFALLFEPHWRYEAHPGLGFGPGFGDRPEPYAGPLTGAEDLPALRARRAEWSAQDLEFLRGRYLGEVAALDRAVGELAAGLRARGDYERAWIFFTSDHGEEFLEHGWFGHTADLHDELVRVPLVVKPPSDWPGFAGRARGSSIAEWVSLVDVAGTILDVAGLAAPADAAGRSLLALLAGEPSAPAALRRELYLHVDYAPIRPEPGAAELETRRRGVVDALSHEKWIEDLLREPPLEASYDLDDDPGERRDLALDPSGAERARRLAEAVRGAMGAPGAPGAPGATED
jgi:arylsulfatase A-like enzyme